MDMSGGKTDCISVQGDVPALTDTVMKEGTSVKWYVLCTDSGREQEVVELDEERKAAMVSNLLVVLCGNHDAQPIVNTGTLY